MVGDLGSSVEGWMSRIEVEVMMHWQYVISGSWQVSVETKSSSSRSLESQHVQRWEGTTGRDGKQERFAGGHGLY